jgi:hypothetical protein
LVASSLVFGRGLFSSFFLVEMSHFSCVFFGVIIVSNYPSAKVK